MLTAGIVLYNPNLERLKENIEAITNQVDYVVLIDNYSHNISEIEAEYKKYNNIHLIKNNSNLGIANALNQIIYYTKQNNCEWALTLDQDSVCMKGLVDEYKRYIHLENIGMITCNILDRNFEVKKVKESVDEYKFVETCITSGCLTNVDACIKVGGFDEKMFIDYVDFDMCTTLKEHGYKILKTNFNGILHELGNSNVRKFFNKEEVIYNHSPFRKYYFTRNGIYYTRKHKKSINTMRSYLRVYRRILLTLLFENKKKEKLIANIRGIFDGYRMKI